MYGERGIVIIGAGNSGTIDKSALAYYGVDKILTMPTTIQASIEKDSSFKITNTYKHEPVYFQERSYKPSNRRERRKNKRKKNYSSFFF